MRALSYQTALGLVIAAALGSSNAAPPTPSNAVSAADPGARVAPQRYQSALHNYQALQDPAPPVADWRAANRRVHEAGGWRAYLREAQQSGAAPATPAAPAAAASKPAAPAADGHQH
jgi:hypothetical protein